jgi:flagellar protein FlaJ
MASKKGEKGGALEIPGAQKADISKRILGAGAGIMVLCIVLGILDFMYESSEGSAGGASGISLPFEWIDWIIFGMMALMGPYGFYMSARVKRVKQIEDRLPDFLRDVAEAGRFGMTLAEAIVVASSGRYGPLTPEIKKMAAQIEWGVPSNEALRLFSERVKTPLVQRMVSIIMKASDAGGNVADVLTMVAHDARETILTESEKGITMSTYVAVIYISFFVFIATVVILLASFLPQMELAGTQLTESLEEYGMGGADLSSVSKLDVSVIPQVSFAFLIAAIAHAIGDGIMAGVLQKGSIPIGLRHAFIMLVMTFLILRLMFGGS